MKIIVIIICYVFFHSFAYAGTYFLIYKKSTGKPYYVVDAVKYPDYALNIREQALLKMVKITNITDRQAVDLISSLDDEPEKNATPDRKYKINHSLVTKDEYDYSQISPFLVTKP